jgi:hypothetical protein
MGGKFYMGTWPDSAAWPPWCICMLCCPCCSSSGHFSVCSDVPADGAHSCFPVDSACASDCTFAGVLILACNPWVFCLLVVES